MGMLYELQLKFGMQGTDDIDRWFSKMKTGVSGVSNEVNTHVPKAEQHLERLATAAEKMQQRFSRAMTLAKAAGAAFLAGKALSGIAGMVGQNPEAAEWSDYNKLYGTNQRDFREHFKGLRRTMAGVDQAGYGKTLFDTSPLGDHPELRKRAVESTFMLKKALGPESTTEQASDLMRKAVGGFGSGKSADERTAIMEKLPGEIKAVLQASGAKGHDIAISLPHVAGMYGSMGKPASEMIADLALTGEAFGERAGEILRNMLSRQGVGYGGLRAELDKQLILQSQFRGARSEAELSDEERMALKKTLKRSEEREAEIGASLLTRQGPQALYKATAETIAELRELSKTRGIDVNALINKHYGETAAQGMTQFLDKALSGRRAELIRQAEAKTPEQMKHDVHASEQSLFARGEIFQQRVQDAWTSVKSTSWGALADLYDAYGGFFDKMSDAWDNHSQKISGNLRSFVSEFSAGFGEAFGGLPNITQKMDELIDKLKGGDTTYWKDLGKELGKIAATDIKPLVEGFSRLGAFLAAMTPSLELVGKTIGFLKDVGEGIAKFQYNHIEGNPGADMRLQLQAEKERMKSNKSVLDPMQPHALFAPAGPQSTLPRNMARPRDVLDGMMNREMEAKLNAAGAAPSAETTLNNEFTVELDGEQIATKVAPRVQQKLQDENDRAGRTAGSRFR